MTISEESRHRLYQRLEEVIGHDEATVLMEHLPPVGWADVATKRDLDHLERRFDRLQSDLRTYMLATMSMIVAFAGAVIAAVRL